MTDDGLRAQIAFDLTSRSVFSNVARRVSVGTCGAAAAMLATPQTPAFTDRATFGMGAHAWGNFRKLRTRPQAREMLNECSVLRLNVLRVDFKIHSAFAHPLHAL